MKRAVLVATGFLIGAIVALQVPSVAQTKDEDGEDRRTVTVSGTATVKARPDEATVSLGVHTEASSAQAAMEQNAERMAGVIAALKDLGIGDADLATSNLSLYPQWSNDGRTIVGYDAENQLSVTLHDLRLVGKAIDAAVEAGANVAGGISFGLSDDNDGADAALADAIEDARGKAETMAGAAGASLGQVMTISETSAPGPMPYYDDRVYAVAEEAGAPTPVNPPTIETQVSVSVTWELS